MLNCVCRQRYEYVAAYGRVITQRGEACFHEICRRTAVARFLSVKLLLARRVLLQSQAPDMVPECDRARRTFNLHFVCHKLRLTQFEYEYEYVKCFNHYLVLNSHLDSLLLRPPF